MLKSLCRNPNLIIWVLAAYFLINAVARISVSNSLELDEAQQALVSQWFDMGYDTQPPFYNWVQYAVVSIFGISVASIALLKNAFLFSTYFLYWLTARKLVSNPAFAIAATFGLLTIPQFSFEAQRDLTHTVAVIFSASLFLYGFFRALREGDIAGYVITGIAVGIGTISKYNFVLLPAAALIATALDSQYRQRLLNWRMLLTIAVAGVIVAPHFLWLLNNFALASSGTLSKMRGADDTLWIEQVGTGAASMVMAAIGFSALTLVIFLAITRRKTMSVLRAEKGWTRLLERIFLVFIILIAMMVLFGGVSHIKDRWLAPLLIILPLYLCLKAEAAGFDGRLYLRRLLPVIVLIMLAIPAALYGRIAIAGVIGKYSKLNVPYAQLAESISATAHQAPALIISGDAHLAGNMRLQFPQVPVDSLTYPHFHPSWKQGVGPVAVVWRDNGKPSAPLPAKLAGWIESNTQLSPSEIDVKNFESEYLYGEPGVTYHFAYVLIPQDRMIQPGQ